MVAEYRRRATSATYTNALSSLPDDEWTRDVALMVTVWTLAGFATILLPFILVESPFVRPAAIVEPPSILTPAGRTRGGWHR